MKILVYSVVVILAAFVVYKIKTVLYYVPSKPNLPNTWWGPETASEKEDTDIRPFRITFSNETLQDLKERLERHRAFSVPLEGVQQQYGINTRVVRKFVDHWKTNYNWKEREEYLNKFPQYKTKIQGLNIHFIHAKPTSIPDGVRVIPILIVHGWPGSVREFYGAIPLLTTPRENQDFVFEVIAPSIPGYGFSDPAVRPGLGPAQIAIIFKNLMLRLGFDKFYVQGGDWGAVITSDMAAMYPEHVLGIHCNMCMARSSTLAAVKQILGVFWPSLVVDKTMQDQVYPLGKWFSTVLLETGYFHLHATKPDTIGVALNDSPVGLAAYILEKFISWTDYSWVTWDDGGLERKFKIDDLIDNIMIYWISGSITTSIRLYAESFSKENRKLSLEKLPIEVPTACAFFKNEFYYTHLGVVSERYKNMLQGNHLPDGGHFAAMEVPQLFADDVWQAVEKFEHFNRYPH